MPVIIEFSDLRGHVAQGGLLTIRRLPPDVVFDMDLARIYRPLSFGHHSLMNACSV